MKRLMQSQANVAPWPFVFPKPHVALPSKIIAYAAVSVAFKAG